jgi:hypothetical protein
MPNKNLSQACKERQSLSSGAATVRGVAIAFPITILVALTSRREFSFNYFLIQVLSLVLCCGIGGYLNWLWAEPARYLRLLRITCPVALFTGMGWFIIVPKIWWSLGPFRGSLLVFLVVMWTVAGGLGIVHLVGWLNSLFRQSMNPGADSWMDGVRDRDLDQI